MMVIVSMLVAVLVAAPAPDQDVQGAGDAAPSTFTIGGTTFTVVPEAVVKAQGLELPPIAPQENAAFDYLRAIEAYWEPEGLTRDDELWHAIGNWRWSGKAGPQVREYLEKNKETLKHIKRAAGKPACRFPYLIEQGEELDEDTLLGRLALPFLAKARALGRFLVVVGKVQEFEGDPAHALDTYLLILRLGNDVAQDGPLINGLVGMATNAVGSRTIKRCLVVNDELDEGILADAQKRLHQLWRTRPNLPSAVRIGPAVRTRWTEWVIGNPASIWDLWHKEPTDEEQAWAESLKTEAGAEKFRKEMGLVTDFEEKISKMPLREFVEKQDELRAEIESKLSPVTMELVGSTLRMPIRYGRADLRWNVLDAVFALARYKAEHDQYPEKLEEVKGLMLLGGLDPLSGMLLKYRLEADGSFTIWSVGEDLKDDGGELGDSHNPWRGDDRVWNSRLLSSDE